MQCCRWLREEKKQISFESECLCIGAYRRKYWPSQTYERCKIGSTFRPTKRISPRGPWSDEFRRRFDKNPSGSKFLRGIFGFLANTECKLRISRRENFRRKSVPIRCNWAELKVLPTGAFSNFFQLMAKKSHFTAVSSLRFSPR